MSDELFTRSLANPILLPDSTHSWESWKVYNCAAFYQDGLYHLFYRAVGKGSGWHSSIGYAVSRDGEHFERFDEPLLIPEHPFERRGIEDPRVTRIGDTYYMTYTGFDGDLARLMLAISYDMREWKRHGEMIHGWNTARTESLLTRETDPEQERGFWSKAGGIFPERMRGVYWMLFGDKHMWLAYSDDGYRWEPITTPFMSPRQNMFDSAHLEMGPPPIKTEHGWLVLYHGVDEKIVYRIGILLLDLHNPERVLYRSSLPVFQPKETYELQGIIDILPGGLRAMGTMDDDALRSFLQQTKHEGMMPQVTLCCGAVVVDGVLRIYYGAGDSVICTAIAPMKGILKAII